MSVKFSGIWKAAKKEKWAYIFLALPFGLIVIFRVIPMIWTVGLSFQSFHPFGSTWIGLENFKSIFSDNVFWKSVLNTFCYTVGVVPFGLCIALLLSTLIFSLKSKSVRTLFKAAFYLPAVTSGAILAMIWIWLFNPSFGSLNYLLSLIKLGPILWLSDYRIALLSLIFMALAIGQGASIILLTAAMGNIPQSLYEAARIDGSNRWQEFFWITLPLLKPTILYLMIIGTIGSFQVFIQIYMMTQGGPFFATTTIAYLVYTTAFDLLDFGKASSIAMVLFVIVATIAFFQYKFLSSEVEY